MEHFLITYKTIMKVLLFIQLLTLKIRLVVGSGLTNYDWYVSPTEHDGFGDGAVIIHIKLWSLQ